MTFTEKIILHIFRKAGNMPAVVQKVSSVFAVLIIARNTDLLLFKAKAKPRHHVTVVDGEIAVVGKSRSIYIAFVIAVAYKTL